MESMDRVCHLCLDAESNNLMLLNDEELTAKIDRVFYFEVTTFSQSCGIICKICKLTIEAFYQYAEKVAQNQTQLRDKIRTELVKVENRAEDDCKNLSHDATTLGDDVSLDDVTNVDHVEEIIDIAESKTASSVKIEEEVDDSNQSMMVDDEKCEESHVLPTSSKKPKLLTQATSLGSNNDEAIGSNQQSDHERSSNEPATQLSAEQFVLQHHKLTCDICLAPLSDFSDLHKHYKLAHAAKGYLRCCNRQIYKKCWMIEHLQVHINPDTFRCELCAKSYSSSKVLKEHTKEVHAPDTKRTFPCTKCQKTFVSRSHLNAHIMVAHGTVPCPQCQKVLSSQGSLRKHLVAVHGEGEKHVCEVCARVFRSKQCFDAHRKEHEGRQLEGKVQCDQCDVFLMNKYCLRKHMRRMHMQPEEEEVWCSICGKPAPNKEALNNHMRRTHNGKQFECNWCDKTFNRPHHMREHVAVHHTGEQLYSCPHCSERFNTKNKRYLHRKTVHPEEYEEELRKRKLKEQ